MARTTRSALLILFLVLGISVVTLAGDEPAVPDAWVEEALEAAGENRAELESVLAHFEVGDDAEKLVGARFLIANMHAHGYVITELQDADGNAIHYDPLAYKTFKESRAAIEALEKKHGELRFSRKQIVKDVEVMKADFLIQHIDHAFAAWRAVPAEVRVGFAAFLDYVLPYRGSQEPLDLWIEPLRERFQKVWPEAGADLGAAHKLVGQTVKKLVRFNERYYLHPTDQSFSEMLESGQGRCEDMTNLMTFAARSVAIATAADYTPAWAHSDNNHAWNVLLDAEGRGFAKGNAHAAKIYRKTYAMQRDNLVFQLGEGKEAPNRFLQSKTYTDVTDQYAPTTDVAVELDPDRVGDERFAYLCVFNGGNWTAIHWGRIEESRVVFDRMGRNIAYLPAVHRDGKLEPVAAPLIVHKNGTIRTLTGTGGASSLIATSVRPKKVSPDTHEVTPESFLTAGTTYLLQRWTPNGWETLHEVEAGEEALRFESLPTDGLYWMVVKESRRLERIFTIQEGRQRFW